MSSIAQRRKYGLQGGGRAGRLSRIRSEIAHALTRELGIPYAEIARQLGVSHVAAAKMMKRGE